MIQKAIQRISYLDIFNKRKHKVVLNSQIFNSVTVKGKFSKKVRYVDHYCL